MGLRAARDEDPLERVVRISQLLDLYGGLLTERQRTFVQMHFEEDLSFGEIASTHAVSRQAVHDAVKNAVAALETYEEKLRLREKGIGGTAEVAPSEGATPSPAAPMAAATSGQLKAVATQARELHERLRRSGGIIYNAEGVTREISALADAIEALIPKEE